MTQVFAAMNHRLSEEYATIALPGPEAKDKCVSPLSAFHHLPSTIHYPLSTIHYLRNLPRKAKTLLTLLFASPF